MDVVQKVKTSAIASAALSMLWATSGLAQTVGTIQATRAPGGVAPGVTTSLHALPANTPAGAAYRADSQAARPAVNPTLPFPNGAPRYEGDLEYQGGAVVEQAAQYQIYITSGACPIGQTTCWGNPTAFLQSLSGSSFIHVVDQYTGRTDGNRYTVSPLTLYGIFTPQPTVLIDADIQLLVQLAASSFNIPSGYGTIIHVFIPPGVDECFDSSLTVCYSPDVPSTFYFCAYHSSVDFPGLGHVLYSVEPYQNVAGCSVPPGSPNGQLVDSTNSVLSHETFETITDPDGTAWINIISNALYGEEIGDECSFIVFYPSAVYFNPSVFNIGHTKYAVQPEYSNSGHACRTSPGD